MDGDEDTEVWFGAGDGDGNGDDEDTEVWFGAGDGDGAGDDEDTEVWFGAGAGAGAGAAEVIGAEFAAEVESTSDSGNSSFEVFRSSKSVSYL